jgi:hypothetical protein
MPTKDPTFQNVDNKLIWQELKHMNESLTKLNGAVAENTAHRTTCQERWRTHEKDHDKVGRDNVIASSISGIAAAILSFAGIHITK